MNCFQRESLHMTDEFNEDTPPDLTINFLSTERGFKMASLNRTSLTRHGTKNLNERSEGVS